MSGGGLAFISFITGLTVIKNKSGNNKFCFILTSSLFFIFAGILTLRAIAWLTLPEVRHLFSSAVINKLQFYSSMLIDTAWTVMFMVLQNRRLTHELIINNKKYSDIFNNSIIPSILINSEGKYIDVNPAFTKITGYSHSEIIGNPIGNITHSDYVDIVKTNLIKLINLETGSYSNHIKIITKSADIIDIQLNATTYFTEEGGFEYILVEFYDISDTIRAEQNLIEKQKILEELNSTKDKFMTIIAHDLRNPFNSIIGFSKLLLKNINKYDINKIEEQVKIINQNAESSYNLLEDMLLWAKSQAGKLKVEKETINFNEICLDIIEKNKLQSEYKNIKIIISDSENTTIEADKNMFQTVFRNLVSNALKFSNKNGKIVISAHKNNGNSIISVTDSGAGIEKIVSEKLWDNSGNVSKTGTENEKGSGLGLIICKELVEIQGGKIWVESEPGKGSIFSFSIPQMN